MSSLLNNRDKIDYLIQFQRSNPAFCEHLLAGFYKDHLVAGDNFIDVGARVGHHLFPMAALVGQRGKGIGIEANSEVAENLMQRVGNDADLITRLKIVAAAASDTPGTAQFYVRIDFQGWSSLYETHVHPGEKNDVKVENVELVLIDDIVAREGWDQCKFIKLDIENAEFMALRGAQKTLEKFNPLVIFENAPRSAAKLNGYSLDEFTEYFESLGYDLHDIFLNKVDMSRLNSSVDLPSYYIASPKSINLLESDVFDRASMRCNEVIDSFEQKNCKAA